MDLNKKHGLKILLKNYNFPQVEYYTISVVDCGKALLMSDSLILVVTFRTR